MKALLGAICATLLLTACGGGSDDGSDGPTIQDDAPRDGVIAGRVLEAAMNVPLAGVEITLSGEAGEVVASTTSDALGDYRFDTLQRGAIYLADFAIDGYRDERFSRVVLGGTGPADLTLEPVRLVSDDNAGDGGLTGTVTGALSGETLGGLRLEFRRGINSRTGDVLASTTTAADGSYAVGGLAYGNYTCVIIGDGLQTTYTTVFVFGGIDRTDQNATISPTVAEGDTRIVLTWGASPRDLDSHLTGPGIDGGAPFHVYFARRESTGVNLDVDDTSGFGPETVTVDTARDGVFRYSVLRYSGGSADALSASGARVQVLRASGLVAEFFVPRGSGDLWTVFDIVDGQILPVGTITEQLLEDDFFAPSLRSTFRSGRPSPADEARAKAG